MMGAKERGPVAEELVEAARRLYRETGEPMTLKAFAQRSGYKASQVDRLLSGGWTELRERAGVPAHPRTPRRYSDDDLLEAFHKLGTELGRIPRWQDINRRGGVSTMPYTSRFGGKRELLRRYRLWVEKHDPRSELKEAARRAGRAPTGRRRPLPERRVVYGKRIDFGSLRRAPTNEKGVIFLFGLLAEELGYEIEMLRGGFPDCEAMQAVDAGRTQWRRVRIEFEYRSGNFRRHGHDASECDLVVCWRHDWPGCPVEVLELGEVVGRGRGEG